MKYIIYFMMMLYGSLCHAIVCKHIVERSETNTRKVYQIQRDALGYMWFMNHAGISRFDGTKLKHYELPAKGEPWIIIWAIAGCLQIIGMGCG